ncbi:MAG: DUF1616 domain-containing protein, partial [Chloroflexota bacterium]
MTIPKRNSLDLLILLNLASLAVIVHTPMLADLPDAIHVAFSSLMVFVLPGYALATAIFDGSERSGIERTLMIVGLSFVIIVLGAVLLHFLPWGLQRWTWMLLLYAIVVIGCAATVYRRGGVLIKFPDLDQALTLINVSVLIKAGMFMVAGGIAISALWMARSAEEYANRFEHTPFTQFWMLPTPNEANNIAVKIGVQSSESNPVAYRLQISIDGKAVFEKSDLKLN